MISDADYAELKRRLLADGLVIRSLDVRGDVAMNSPRPRGPMVLQNSPGVTGQVVTSQGAGRSAAWATPSAGFANPMTTLGDLIKGGGGGAPQRLGVGTSGQVLTVSGGVPTWATNTASVSWPLTNSGDECFQPNGIANNALCLHNNASAVSGVQIQGSDTNNGPIIAVIGSGSVGNLTIQSKPGAQIILSDGSSRLFIVDNAGSVWVKSDTSRLWLGGAVSGNTGRVMRLDALDATANYLTVISAQANQPPTIAVDGSDTNIGLTISPKASGVLTLTSSPDNVLLNSNNIHIGSAGTTLRLGTNLGNPSGIVLSLQGTNGSGRNWTSIAAGPGIGDAPQVSAEGLDTNVDLTLQGKGTGVLNIGNPTTTTTAPAAGGADALPATPTGYLTVKIGGTARKLAYY